MRMNPRIWSLLIIFSFTACATSNVNQNYERVVGISLDELYAQINLMEAVEVDELLDLSSDLREREIDVEINSAAAKVIYINGSKHLTRAYRVNDGKRKTVEIRSYIVPVRSRADYLFFPVLTVYDASKNLLTELQPDNDYSVSFGTLTVKFAIPANASYMVIHTNQKYLDVGSIDGDEGGLSPAVNYSSNDIGVVVGAMLGGAVGGAIAGVMTANSNYDSAPPENYFFGPGGILDIKVLN